MFEWLKKIFKKKSEAVIPVYDEYGQPENDLITKLINDAWNNGYAEYKEPNHDK